MRKLIVSMFKKYSIKTLPLMRCPKRLPKCYEMTEVEKQQALTRADELLNNRNNL